MFWYTAAKTNPKEQYLGLGWDTEKFENYIRHKKQVHDRILQVTVELKLGNPTEIISVYV